MRQKHLPHQQCLPVYGRKQEYWLHLCRATNGSMGSINQIFGETLWGPSEKFHIYMRNNPQKYFFNIMYIRAATLAYATLCKWPYSTLYLYSEIIFLNMLTLNGTCFNQNSVLIPNMLLSYFWKLYFFCYRSISQ